MTNFAPTINVSMKTPEVLPDVPTFHAAGPSTGEMLATGLTGAGKIVKQLGEYKQEEEKLFKEQAAAAAKTAEIQEGQRYAADVRKLVKARVQTGNRTRFDQSMRALDDAYGARGILSAQTMASIRDSNDYGYLKINEESRSRWAKYDDESQQKIITELKTKYPTLKGQKDSRVLDIYNNITNARDFGVNLQYQMSQVDPNKYPETYNKLKQQRDMYFKNNVVGRTLLAIGNSLESNPDAFKDPVQVEQFEQEQIASLVRNGISAVDASIIVNSAMTDSGAYQMLNNAEQLFQISNKQLQDMITYRQNKNDWAMGERFPQLVINASLSKVMGPEVAKRFFDSGKGQEVAQDMAYMVGQLIAENKVPEMAKYSDKSAAINAADTLQRSNAPATVKGATLSTAGRSILTEMSLSSGNLPVVIKNAQGVYAKLTTPFAKATERQLSESSNPLDQNVKESLIQTREHAKALANFGIYLQSSHTGAQNLRWIIENSTIADNLRVNAAGDLVFVPTEGALEAIWEGLQEQGTNFGAMIEEINADVKKQTGLKGKDLINFFKSANIPELTEGEFPHSAPTFTWTKDGKKAGLGAGIDYWLSRKNATIFPEVTEERQQEARKNLAEAARRNKERMADDLTPGNVVREIAKKTEKLAQDFKPEPYKHLEEAAQRNLSNWSKLGQMTREDEYGIKGYNGNINLDKRPVLKNEDGTISTVSSIGIEEDGQEVLIPTVVFDADGDAIRLSEDEAIAYYYQTGKHLGKYKNREEAKKIAEAISERGRRYE